MTKKDIIDIVSNKTRLKKNHTKAVVECIFDVFIEMLARDKRIEIRNFGVFKVKDTPARVGRNPVTKEAAPVPPRRIVQFKAGKEMKEQVNQFIEDRKRQETTDLESMKRQEESSRGEAPETPRDSPESSRPESSSGDQEWTS